MFIAVEWAEKGDLKQLVRQAHARQQFLEERRIWHYLWQISSALKHMQSVRIMHRDLKPANIFIDAKDNLKLGDLGLGRDFTSQTMEAYSRVGTPLYMSPEVLQGSGYDFKSDVWSLGCIGYELCALKNPFKDETKKMSLYDLFQKINSGVYLPLSASRYSSELRYLIDSMLRVDPNERVDINDVVSYCEKQIAILNKASPEKPISRTYFANFAVNEPTEEKVRYFFELSYWLMGMNYEENDGKFQKRPSNEKKSKKVNPFKGINYEKFASRDDAVEKLLQDVKKFKVALPDHFTSRQLLDGYGEGVCYIVNDLTNRELIRRKFKFEQFELIDQNQNFANFSDEDDQEETLVFSKFEENKVGSKDITSEALLFKEKRGQFFQKLNAEQIDDDLHDQFQSLLSDTMKGRTDLLYNTNSNARTGSTATSENTQQMFFNQTSNKYKTQLHEILQENEILETSIMPEEWAKECERVKDQLNYKLKHQGTLESEVEEIINRREQTLEHIKTVKEFSESNIPILISSICDNWSKSLLQIRTMEMKLTQQNGELINSLKSTQQYKQQYITQLKHYATNNDSMLQELDQLDQNCANVEEKLEEQMKDNSGEERMKAIKKRIKYLKNEANKMHQREGIIRVELEMLKLKEIEDKNDKNRKVEQKKKRQQTLKINASKFSQIIEESKEDDDEFYERQKRIKHAGTSLLYQKKKVDDDEEYSWDSDFD